jgi:hypothetical protein
MGLRDLSQWTLGLVPYVFYNLTEPRLSMGIYQDIRR